MKTAVLVSGGGTNLQALLDAKAAGGLPHVQFDCVVSSRVDAYALKRAENAGVAVLTLARRDFASGGLYGAALLNLLRGRGVEVVVLAGFLSILPPAFCRAYPGRIINVHPSLIPSFCGDGFYGLKVHQAALDYGVKVTGATVHLVSEVTDGGKILLQKAVEVNDGDTPETLQRRVMEQAEWILLPRALETLCAQLEGTDPSAQG